MEWGKFHETRPAPERKTCEKRIAIHFLQVILSKRLISYHCLYVKNV